MSRTTAWRPCVLLLAIVLGLAGCGVTATDRPVDEGDAAAGQPGPGAGPRVLPRPSDAGQPDELVTNFLMAAAGGGAQANERMTEYLAGAALGGWTDPANVDNPELSVVRVVAGPSMLLRDAVRGTPVTVQYQPVGTLTDRGRVDELTSLSTQTVTFWVTFIDEQLNLRISEIEGWPPGQLLLSDQALTEYYQMQPIYFWDRDYTALVPDLRYVPLTITEEQRAKQRLTWLAAEPPPWLSGTVQSLPVGTTSELTAAPQGVLQVRLSQAGIAPDDHEAAKRLMFQLQWSLSGGEGVPKIDLYIDGQPVAVEFSEPEFREALHTWFYRAEEVRYDIVNGVVAPLPAPLVETDNSGVVSAAIRREPAAAALVRSDGFGRRSLSILTEDGPRPVDLPANTTLGRPSFVPGTETVLVPTGGSNGRLMAVPIGGVSTDATGGRLSGVSVAAVSPDGRRVAIIADGALYVAPLNVSTGTVTVGSATRQLLAGQLTASTVTWTAESWLLVAGVRGDDEPTLWRVTADGVVARDLSVSLLGLRVADLVCWPNWSNSSDGVTEVLAVADRGVYTFRLRFEPDSSLTAPFFG
jgi:hypothetical protein